MIDSDELLSVANFDLLCSVAHEKERPIVAGLVFAAFGKPTDIHQKPVPTIFYDGPEGFVSLDAYPKNSIFEVDAAGTGCLLIHRSVLIKMRESADENMGDKWCWFWDGPINGEWVGEDLLFCRRVRALGFPITVHTGVVLPHYKGEWLDERHHDLWQKEHPSSGDE